MSVYVCVYLNTYTHIVVIHLLTTPIGTRNNVYFVCSIMGSILHTKSHDRGLQTLPDS